MIVQAEGKRSSNGEVVRKEISVRIIVACGHDTLGAPEAGLGEGFFAAIVPCVFDCLKVVEDWDVLQVRVYVHCRHQMLLILWAPRMMSCY